MNKSPKFYTGSKVHEFPRGRYKDIKWVRSTTPQTETVVPVTKTK